jgi:hypothetical protein
MESWVIDKWFEMEIKITLEVLIEMQMEVETEREMGIEMEMWFEMEAGTWKNMGARSQTNVFISRTSFFG